MKHKNIWIFGDLRTQHHWKDSCKVMAKALGLAQAIEAQVTMVLLGAGKADISLSKKIDLSACVSESDATRQALEFGAQAVICLEHPDLAIPRADVYAGVLADFAVQRDPWLILFALNDFSRETAAMGAQRCQAGMIADCTELAYENNFFVGRCPAWGGQILADITLANESLTAFVTVQPHDAPKPVSTDGESGSVETVTLDTVSIPQGLRLNRRSLEVAEGQRLEDARVVVCGGAGLADARGFGLIRELAGALGWRNRRHAPAGALSLGG